MVIETVTVGNAGNAGELSGEGVGGGGLDRICGAVDYAYNRARIKYTTRIAKAGQTGSFRGESVELVLAWLLRPPPTDDDHKQAYPT